MSSKIITVQNATMITALMMSIVRVTFMLAALVSMMMAKIVSDDSEEKSNKEEEISDVEKYHKLHQDTGILPLYNSSLRAANMMAEESPVKTRF
ncbi:hypothetical protein HNY73_020195 [Argiope bruennichi]|uniref:Uncharacterized protein n=1 Tax=Argiope bruennichi TaxID=94029 RepID=A0A8T0E5U3_ARGBR|nr:hypothetical protein HNY73_020195 [Argiope bruennichi]